MPRYAPRLLIPALALATVALLLLAAHIAVRNLDLAGFRPEISAQVSAVTGREFRIGEQLALGFHRGLVIRADKLALGNPAWARQPDLLRVGQARARLALWPLLRGRVEIEHVELEQVELFLETDDSGRGNWQIGGDREGGTGGGFEIRSLGIRSGSVTWLRHGEAQSAGLRISDIALDLRHDGQVLAISGEARLGDEALALKADLGTAAQGTVALAAHLRAGGGELKAEGTLDTSGEVVRPALRLTARDIDMRRAGGLIGQRLPAVPPVDADFDLTRSDAQWRVDNLRLAAGRSTLQGQGSLRLATDGGRPRLTADLHAEVLDLPELTPRAETGPAQAGGGFSLPPSAVAALGAFDATLSLRVGELVLSGPRLLDLSLQGALREGRLSLDSLETSIAGGGTVSAHAALDSAAAVPAWSVGLEAAGLPASSLFPGGDSAVIEAPAELSTALTSRGATLEQMASNLDGEARLVIGKGRAKLRAVDTLVGGLSTLTGQLLEHGSDDAGLNCVIADFALAQGVASTRVLLIDSAVSTVRGDGEIDLGRRVVDLTFTPRPKKPTLTVAVPVHVRGALSSPDFVPDRLASLTKLIGVAGAFVYPPAAIAALGDLGVAGADCSGLLEPGAQPAPPESKPDRVIKGVGDAARSLGDGIKGLFER